MVRENFFFKDQLFWFLQHSQDFDVALSGTTRVKGYKLPYPSHLENSFNLKIRPFKRILDVTCSKGGWKC